MTGVMDAGSPRRWNPLMANDLFDPSERIADLLARTSVARSVLAAYGLDTCCGGVHSLAEACRARGVSLDAVLEDLASAHRAAEAVSIVPPTMTVRELLRRYPATAPVLARHGLGDCGGSEGPEEPLAWFATVHRIPLDGFLRELREVASRSGPAVPIAPAESPAKAFAPHFILGSLLLTLTLGATTGAINLLRIAAGGDVPISHRQIHGHTQVLGFAALFLMGIAFHALPRILGIPSPRRAPEALPVFWAMFAGVVLRNVGQPFNVLPFGRLLSLASSVLEAVGAALFAAFVFRTLSRARGGKYGPDDPILRFLRTGTVFFVAAVAIDLAQGIWLAGHFETALPVSLTESFYFASLYGFLLAWIYGFGNRVVSLFLGVGPAAPRSPGITLALLRASVPLALASYAPGLPLAAALVLRDAGLAAAALSALVFLAGHGFLHRRPEQPALRTPGAPTVAIRAAFGALGLWAVLELAAIVISRTTRVPAQNLWWSDAARHVFTIGFVTLLIVGMSFRILPVFSGRRLWSPRLAYATYALLLGGAALRLLQYPAAWHPVFYRAGSYMGIPVVLALLLFVVNLVRTMRGAAGSAAAEAPAPVASRPTFVATLPAR